MVEYINTAISIIALVIASIALYFSWIRMRKERPIFSHEIFSCLHKVEENGKSTNLEIVFMLHNGGDRGTKLTKIEVSARDIMGVEHHSSKELSQQLEANSSTDQIRSFFDFMPTFQYGQKMHCRFTIQHTTGKYPFDYESNEAKHYLQDIHAGWIA